MVISKIYFGYVYWGKKKSQGSQEVSPGEVTRKARKRDKQAKEAERAPADNTIHWIMRSGKAAARNRQALKRRRTEKKKARAEKGRRKRKKKSVKQCKWG